MATKPIFDDVQPWPEAKQAPADRLHNKPPPEETIPAEFREALLDAQPKFMDLLDRMLGNGEEQGAVHRAICTDDETLGKCGDLVDKLKAAKKHVDATHQAIKAPYLISGRLVDGEKNALVGRIDNGLQIVVGLQQTYLRQKENERRERERKEAEERRRLEELACENNIETALPPPAPAPVKAAPIRSDAGATVSTSKVYIASVDDVAKAFKAVKHDAKVVEAVTAAVQRLVTQTKGQMPIAGVTITEDIRVNNR